MDYDNITLRHICESCGKDELLTADEAHKQGWDYPPKMGAYKVVSPRKCGSCSIESTLWWALSFDNIPLDQLSEKHAKTLERIISEPESILPAGIGGVKISRNINPNRKQAHIYDWCIVRRQEAKFTASEFMESVFAPLSLYKENNLGLFGRVLKDYRADQDTGRSTDGHRVITSVICDAGGNTIGTENTMYTLGAVNPRYAAWCAEKGHKVPT